MSAADHPWYWHPERNRILAADVRVGDTITGTGASGDFTDWPVPVNSVANRTVGRKPEIIVNGHRVYYADAVLEVKDRPTYKNGRVVR